MRRLSGVLLAGAILVLPAFSQPRWRRRRPPPENDLYRRRGDRGLRVNAGKDADYEKVIATLKDALAKSPRPEAKQQLAGWKVIKNSANQPDGSSLYVHIITPVVKDADYSITHLVYDVVKDPTEQNNFFDLYKGALQKPLFVIQGPIVSDLSK